VTEPRPACALLLLLCTVRLSTVGTCSASCRLPPTGAAVRSPPAAGPPCCSAAAAAAGLLPVPVAAAAPPAQVHCCSWGLGKWGGAPESGGRRPLPARFRRSASRDGMEMGEASRRVEGGRLGRCCVLGR
jgi:hypothetical protein